MDLLTLGLCREILSSRSIRRAAAALGRAPSTASGALFRLESEIAVPLVRREGAALVLTLEAERCLPAIIATCERAQAFLHTAGLGQAPVPPIRLDTLLRFQVVAQSGSIRAAARNLGVGQPQLTRQMRDLERVIGQPLLARTPRGVGLTPLGRRLVPLAEGIVTEWEQVSSAAAERFRRHASAWRIGTVMPLGHESSIARMLARLAVLWAPHQRRHPLQISSHSADELMAGLKSRRFDLVVLDHGLVPRDFHSLLISRSPLALVGAPHLLTSDAAAAVTRHPLVLASPRSGIRQETMRWLEGLLGPERTRAVEILEVEAMPVIINLVAHHGYLSVLPLASVLRLPFDLAHVSLAPGHMRELVMVWRRSGLPDALIDAVYRATLHEQAQEPAPETASPVRA